EVHVGSAPGHGERAALRVGGLRHERVVDAHALDYRPAREWCLGPLLGQPPIIDIDRVGRSKSGWLILWPSHFTQTAERMIASISWSDAPLRRAVRRSASCMANRQARN